MPSLIHYQHEWNGKSAIQINVNIHLDQCKPANRWPEVHSYYTRGLRTFLVRQQVRARARALFDSSLRSLSQRNVWIYFSEMDF